MKLKTFLAFIVIGFLSTTVFAQLHPLDRLARFKNCPQYTQLSQANRDKVKAIVNDAKQKMSPVWAQLHKTWFAMEAQFEKNKLDKSTISKMSEKLTALYGKVLQNFTTTRLRIIEETGFRPAECFKVSRKPVKQPKSKAKSQPESSPCDNPNSSMCAIPIQK